MKSQLRKLVLVRRYFWGSVLIAVIPFLILAGFYDRYANGLYESLLVGKLEGELQASVARIDSFIGVQSKRLENLSDLPEIGSVFSRLPNVSLPPSLLDFLYLEVGDPDIYNIGFYNTSGEHLRSFPDLPERLQSVRVSSGGNLGLIVGEPQMPTYGQPGWFQISQPVIRQGGMIGTLALRMRLSSLTEQTSSLYRSGVYEGVVYTPKNKVLNVLGIETDAGNILMRSNQFLPGWTIGLKQSGEFRTESEPRLWLLLGAAVSVIGVTLLFFNLSEGLARMIIPIQVGAEAIANGDLTSRVPESAPGELGLLAKSFNEMSRQLTHMVSSRVDAERRSNLGNLAAGIAHEIRNPLAIIQTTIHGLTRSESDNDRRKMLDAISEEIVRTDAIVEEFMNYARPRIPAKAELVLNDIVQNVIVLSSASAHEVGVTISVTGEKSLPVFADAGQLQQVIMNVVLNGLQAMPNGGHMLFRSTRKESFVELTISDNGEGMSHDDLLHAQQPFYTRKRNGTGLGLAICTQLLAVNNGSIELASTEGSGTLVRIQIPYSAKYNSRGVT